MKNVLHQFPKIIKALLFFTAFVLARPAIAQTISGYVTDGNANTPLQGAVITVFSDKDTQFYETGLDGFYQIDLYAGTYTMSCSRFGYENTVIENIRLEYDKIEVVDIKLYKTGAKPQQSSTPANKGQQTFDNNANQTEMAQQIAEPDYSRSRTNAFRLNHAASLGIGYQMGEIGGFSGEFGLSLSRLFGGRDASSNLFLLIEAGFEKQAYKSNLFNDVSLDYEFGFRRIDAGLQKIFVVSDYFLISPSLSFGMEQAEPKTNNVHELIDGGQIYAIYFKPAVMLGYAVTPSLVLNLKASYFAMMKETANQDNLILAKKGSGENDWKPYHYADDFFLNRKGVSFMLGIRLFF